MRPLLFIAVALPLILAIQAEEAAAQNYPWCAQYRVQGGARNCGFVTFEQCMATVSGVGGYCETNALYRPEADTAVKRRLRRAY